MFKDRDIVCFLGDSITANGGWIAEIYQYLRTKYKIKCYNCGVSGGMTVRAELYMHATCLIHNPDYVVTMYGMNDIASWYMKSDCVEPDKEALLEQAFEDHKVTYENIIKNIIASGAIPIMCLPTPYDEVNDLPCENLFCQARLDMFTEFQKELAKKYNVLVVDLKNALLPFLKTDKIINDDRVHPTELGHHIMAQYFLEAIGEKEHADYDTPFIIEDWNLKRREAERAYKPMDYVEFCDIFDLGWKLNKTNEEKKLIVKERYDKFDDKTQYIPSSYKLYMDKIDIRDRLVGEVVRLTVF